jgi:hypothetical protein
VLAQAASSLLVEAYERKPGFPLSRERQNEPAAAMKGIELSLRLCVPSIRSGQAWRDENFDLPHNA